MSRIRLFFTGIIIFFLVGAGVAWILSNQGSIPSSWASSLGTTFSILGVLVAFVQWLLPLPSSDTKPPETKPSADSVKSSHAREIFHNQIYDRLTPGYGALVVYEKSGNIGENVSVSHDLDKQRERLHANIVERIVNGHPLFAAVFPHLKPDDYWVSGPDDSGNITVSSGHVAEVDWRSVKVERNWREERKLKKKAEQREKSLYGLRVKSVMIGLGGVLFLVHRYLMLPYFDVAGIILMSLGVVNLLSSLVLDWLGWLQDAGFRPSVFMLELGGVVFLLHRYMVTPYFDIAGIILMGLGGIGLLISLIVYAGDNW